MISNFSFFQKLVVIELLVSETIEKKISKVLALKTFFFLTFSFCGQKIIAKTNPRRCFEKRLLIKILQNSKGEPDKNKKLQSFLGFSTVRKVLQQLFLRGNTDMWL